MFQPDNDWRVYGNCHKPEHAGIQDIFFEEDVNSKSIYAKWICRDCPVRLDCLQAGLEERYGIWGGMLYRDRVRVKKGLARGRDLFELIEKIDTSTRVLAKCFKYE